MIATRKLAAAAVLLTTFASAPTSAQTCTPKHTFTTVEPGFITNAATVYAPYSMIDDAGNMTGIDGDILHAIAALECLKVKAIPVDASGGIQYVISHKADTTSGDWYRTAERARVVNLSAPLYVDQMAVYSTAGWDDISQFEDKTVGSTLGNLWNNDMKKVFGDRLKLYPTSVAMQQDLVAGRIVVGVDGASIGVVSQKAGELKGIKIEIIKPDKRVAASQEAGQGTFPMTKANTDMLKAFDEDIKTLHEDGTIDKLLVKYGLSASASQTGEPRLIK